MGIKFANSAFATLAAGITNSATSITLTTGQGARFPSLTVGDYFYATLIDTSNNLEIVKCTARAGDVLTVVRAQESTTARAYSTGDRIEMRVTAQGLVDASPVQSVFGRTGEVALLNADLGSGTANSGTYLRGDRTWAAITTGFSGGTTTTSASDITLTAASTQLQYVELTAADRAVVLPDATTLTRGSPIFIIFNSGSRYINIKDSTGTVIATKLAAGTTHRVSLLDNSTAAGRWAVNDTELYVVVGAKTTSAITVPEYVYLKAVALTSTTFVLYYQNTTTTTISAVAATLSGSTFTFGTPVNIFSAANESPITMSIIRYSNTQFVCTYGTYNGSTAVYTQGIRAGTVSGTTITLGTATSAISTNTGRYSNFTAMITSTVGVWMRMNNTTNSVGFVGYTLSGTTFTFGTVVSNTTFNDDCQNLFQVGTGVCMFSATSTNTARVSNGFISNAGTAITIGNTYTYSQYNTQAVCQVSPDTVATTIGYFKITSNAITSFVVNRDNFELNAYYNYPKPLYVDGDISFQVSARNIRRYKSTDGNTSGGVESIEIGSNPTNYGRGPSALCPVSGDSYVFFERDISGLLAANLITVTT